MGTAEAESLARRELAELVDDHLTRGGTAEPAMAALTQGLALIGSVVDDVQARRGNWGAMLATLRKARANLDASLVLGAPATPTVNDALAKYARRKYDFAALLIGEIERLQAGETTLV